MVFPFTFQIIRVWSVRHTHWIARCVDRGERARRFSLPHDHDSKKILCMDKWLFSNHLLKFLYWTRTRRAKKKLLESRYFAAKHDPEMTSISQLRAGNWWKTRVQNLFRRHWMFGGNCVQKMICLKIKSTANYKNVVLWIIFYE